MRSQHFRAPYALGPMGATALLYGLILSQGPQGCTGVPAPNNLSPSPSGSTGPLVSAPPEPLSPTTSPRPASTPVSLELRTKVGLAMIGLEFRPGLDVVVVVKNLGTKAIDLPGERWQVCGGQFRYGLLSKTKTSIASGSEIRIHVNSLANCTESDTEFCLQNGILVTEKEGNFGIYTGVISTAEFSNHDRLVDYVEWGQKNLPREDVAIAAKLWREDTFIQIPPGQATMAVRVVGASGAENWQ